MPKNTFTVDHSDPVRHQLRAELRPRDLTVAQACDGDEGAEPSGVADEACRRVLIAIRKLTAT